MAAAGRKPAIILLTIPLGIIGVVPGLLVTGQIFGFMALLGIISLWLGGGPLFESMAVAILFGLLFATILTLGFVPTLYSLFYRVSFKGYADGSPGLPPAAEQGSERV